MRFISTKTHGYLDYIVGVLFVAAPWIIGLDRSAAEGMIFIILGIMAIIYSLITDYELGAIRLLPMPIHLTLDILSGILLAASPWLFGFADNTFLPHLFFGLFEIVAALATKKRNEA